MRHLQQAAMATVIGLGAMTAALPAAAHAGAFIGISVNVAPPLLPIYDQPPIPARGYIWTPGYWAWDGGDYYWVPGTWVLAPRHGYLWTPAYWDYGDGGYVFHEGYWGTQVGFYGGIDYGFGYTGDGYQGGYWNNNQFYYNQSVNNFGGVHVANVYNRPVGGTRGATVSYNGGPGGLNVRPTRAQLAVAHEARVAPTPMQLQNRRAAAATPLLHAATNHGLPPIAATSRPATFSGPGVVRPRGGGGFAPGSARVAAVAPGAARQAGAKVGALAGAQVHVKPGQAPAHMANLARPYPAVSHTQHAMARQTLEQPGAARSAEGFGVPASAHAPPHRQSAYGVTHAYQAQRPATAAAHEPMAMRRAPSASSFSSEHRGAPPAHAFRAAPSAQAHAFRAAPSAQAHAFRAEPSAQAHMARTPHAAPMHAAPMHAEARGAPHRKP